MKSDNEDVGKRIDSLLVQLQSELAILDKIVYKGKNQHRRAFYFQYLLKVRRDLKLLESANLKKILNFIFQIINKETSNRRVKRRKLNIEEHQFQMRLLGVARLLSQMVEPIVKAAIEFSTLLARSFFMGFSLTNLALLARLRVLVQQILLEVVSVFNMSSSFWQWGQSTVLNLGGVEVIREYHPSDNDVTALECVWEADKFILVERKTNTRNTNDQVPMESCNIKYQTIEAFLGDDDDEGRARSPEESFVEGYVNASGTSQKLRTESRRQVAFVSVSHSMPLLTKEGGSSKKEVTDEKEEPFFNLLAAGNTKDSIF